MINNQSTPPARNELEISIFGPGYGESILLHIGAGNWILVDSCLNPVSKQPAALQYLRELKVDVTQKVDLIIATHWHDDHVRGLSALVEACCNAKLVISNALRDQDFLTLTSAYCGPSILESSGVDEFARAIQILEKRKSSKVRFNPPLLASAGRSLYHKQISLASSTIEAKIFSLSPSDASILQSHVAFAELLSEQKHRRKRVPNLTPNFMSVVLWIEVNTHRILLGADLERTSDPSTGWSIILSESTVLSGRAKVFKVPHHGSENAHHPGVWHNLLSDEPFALISPFNKGVKPLPSMKDIQRIISLTPNAYTTSPSTRPRIKWRNRIVKEFVKQATKSVHPPNCGWGHIRLRQPIERTDSAWHIELFGDAYSLSESAFAHNHVECDN